MLDSSTVLLVVNAGGWALAGTSLFLNRGPQRAQIRSAASQELAVINEALNRTITLQNEKITGAYEQIADLSQRLVASNKECDERLDREMKRQREWFESEIARIRREVRTNHAEGMAE